MYEVCCVPKAPSFRRASLMARAQRSKIIERQYQASASPDVTSISPTGRRKMVDPCGSEPRMAELENSSMRNLASQGLENQKKIFYHLNLHIIIIEFILASIVLFFTPKNHPRMYPGFYRTIFYS